MDEILERIESEGIREGDVIRFPNGDFINLKYITLEELVEAANLEQDLEQEVLVGAESQSNSRYNPETPTLPEPTVKLLPGNGFAYTDFITEEQIKKFGIITEVAS